MKYATVTILGVRVHAVDFQQTLDQIMAWVEEPREAAIGHTRQICTVNPEFIMEARRDAHFAGVLQQADLCVPDGIGVLGAARLQGVCLRERVTGSDGIYRICELADVQGLTVFLLGAAAGVAVQAAANLRERYPGLQVVGTYSGSPDDEQWPEIQRHLQKAQPDILLVAYGHPRQDFWIDRHRHELPATVAMGVGGAFDFVAGVTKRAPLWMQGLGLEWLYRFITQPWRWRRMLVLPRFAGLVLWEVLNQQRKTISD